MAGHRTSEEALSTRKISGHQGLVGLSDSSVGLCILEPPSSQSCGMQHDSFSLYWSLFLVLDQVCTFLRCRFGKCEGIVWKHGLTSRALSTSSCPHPVLAAGSLQQENSRLGRTACFTCYRAVTRRTCRCFCNDPSRTRPAEAATIHETLQVEQRVVNEW